MHFVDIAVENHLQCCDYFPLTNNTFWKNNMSSNRLVCSVDQEDTICSMPGKRMMPTAITIPFFKLFYPTILTLIFCLGESLGCLCSIMRAKRLASGLVIECDGLCGFEILFSAVLSIVLSHWSDGCTVGSIYLSVFQWPIWAKLSQLGEGLNSQDTQQTYPCMWRIIKSARNAYIHRWDIHERGGFCINTLCIRWREKQTVHMVRTAPEFCIWTTLFIPDTSNL